jgi:hypothetical protein
MSLCYFVRQKYYLHWEAIEPHTRGYEPATENLNHGRVCGSVL